MKDPVDRTPSEDDGFIGRWARRKSALRRGDDLADPPGEGVAGLAEAAPEEPLPVAVETPAEHAPQSEEGVQTEVAPVEKPPLPALDSLTGDSDFSAFMSPEVDATLRRAALRKLFHAPGMNITDGLDDYDDDYTSFEPLGDTITADMRHQMEVKEKRAERERLEAEQAKEQAALEDGAGPGEEEQERLAAGEADAETGETSTADTETGETSTADTETGETTTAATEAGKTTAVDTEMGETTTADTEAGETGLLDDESRQAPGADEDAAGEPPAGIAGSDEAAVDEQENGDDEHRANRNAAQTRPGDEPRG